MFYSDYVKHCMQFYARCPNPKFHSSTDKNNWRACKLALKEFSENDKKILLAVYRVGDNISKNVYNMSKSKGIRQDSIWQLINELERKVAKKRGLL